jgi:hypothetical protein
MATKDSILFTLPLEIRQSIYEFASDRPTGSRLILKEYFEKIDESTRLPPQAFIAADNTATSHADEEDSEIDEAGDDVEQDEAEDGQGTEVEVGAGIGVDEVESDHDDTPMNSAVDVYITAASVSSAPLAVDLTADSEDEEMQEAAAPIQPAFITVDLTDDNSETENAQDGGFDGIQIDNGEDSSGSEEDDEEDTGETEDEESELENEESDGDEDEVNDGDGTITAAVPTPALIERNYGRNTKYRHTLPIIQLTHCPPPKGLLGTCKEVNAEAIAYYRNKCVLTVDVNKGFEHISFFIETMDKLVQQIFSPLEHIRKLRLVVTWDSEWLREKSTPPDRQLEEGQMFFFGFHFAERLQVIINLLNACPELEKVTIDYHDTEDTPASRSFMVDKLMDLHTAIAGKLYRDEHGLMQSVDIETREHFSVAGTAHARNSPLALRRTEFDHFLLGGLMMR